MRRLSLGFANCADPCPRVLASAATKPMSDKAFFDTNVLVYVVGQRDERTAKAEALVANGGVVSVQVLNELVSVSRRKLGMSWEEISDALAAIRVLCPSPMPLT